MGFWELFFLFLFIAVGLIIWVGQIQAKHQTAQSTALSTIPDFNPAVMFLGGLGGAGVALDPVNNKFAISYGAHNSSIFRFEDLVGVEVLRNGSSVQKTNRGGQAIGAAAGAVLLGPVGLLLGGLTGSKRSIEKVDRLSLKIFTNNLVQPVHEIVFFAAPGSDPNSFLVKQASQNLDAWHGRFQTILHNQASAKSM